MLDAAPDLKVVGEASDGIEAADMALREDVDLAILDVAMPLRTGLQAARELAKRRPELRILMLSMHDTEDYCFQALKAGASGYVLKTRGRPRAGRRLPRRDARRAVPVPAGRARGHARVPGRPGRARARTR